MTNRRRDLMFKYLRYDYDLSYHPLCKQGHTPDFIKRHRVPLSYMGHQIMVIIWCHLFNTICHGYIQ